MSIQIADLKIKFILEKFLDFIKTDYEAATGDKSDSWLYRVFQGVVFGGFDYYAQAINIFVTRDKESSRKLEVRMSFDPTKPEEPSFYVSVPSEKPGAEDSIGMGQSDENYYTNDNGSFTEKYTRHFTGDYEIMVTSSNENEVKLLYRFLQAALISLSETWQATFTGTFSFSGKQLVPNYEIIPYPYFMQVFSISIDSQIEVPRVGTDTYGDDIEFIQQTITIG